MRPRRHSVPRPTRRPRHAAAPAAGHAEHKVDAILADGSRRVFDLDCRRPSQLARHVAAGDVASLQTREFNFHETFLKLTGTEFV